MNVRIFLPQVRYNRAQRGVGKKLLALIDSSRDKLHHPPPGVNVRPPTNQPTPKLMSVEMVEEMRKHWDRLCSLCQSLLSMLNGESEFDTYKYKGTKKMNGWPTYYVVAAWRQLKPILWRFLWKDKAKTFDLTRIISKYSATGHLSAA